MSIRFLGRMIIVSHDRDFLDGLVDKMYEFRDGKVREHLGSVSEFLAKRKLENLRELERKFEIEQNSESAKAMKEAELAKEKARIEQKEQKKLDRNPIRA